DRMPDLDRTMLVQLDDLDLAETPLFAEICSNIGKNPLGCAQRLKQRHDPDRRWQAAFAGADQQRAHSKPSGSGRAVRLALFDPERGVAQEAASQGPPQIALSQAAGIAEADHDGAVRL